LKQIVVTLQELDDLRVEFCSVRDQFDLTTASGRLLMHLISSFAEFERSLISERTIAGLVHTRSKGTILGRPKTINEDEIRRLRANGLSFRKIMKEIGCSMGAVNRALGGAPKTCADSHEESQVGTGVSDG
jgi:DNA invertase Pin-like site-specific DNA recombinase